LKTKLLIQPNRSAEFFCANLRKPFFTPPRRKRRKKNADTFAGFHRIPPRRIKRKSTLIQPYRSAEFFCANLRKLFSLGRGGKEKHHWFNPSSRIVPYLL
jgi:hypothetical protein